MRECLKFRQINSLQPPYNMFMRHIEKEFSFCEKHGIGIVTYGPLAYGLLTGKFKKDTKFPETDWRSGKLFPDPGDWQAHIDLFHGRQFKKYLSIVERLRKTAEKLGKTVGQLSMAWVLSNPEVTSAIVGAKRPSQMEQNIGGVGWKLPKTEIKEINQILHSAI